MAWHNEYSQPLTYGQAAHFTRRVAFGASPQQLRAYTGRTAASLFDELSKALPPAPPTDSAGKTFHDLPFGAPETDNMKQNMLDGQHRVMLKQWWLGLMLDPARGLTEKLLLFWQNHFVVESDAVQDVRFLYVYMETLRQYAQGNFRSFVIAITKDPAMLRYLNGNENVVERPNENYARELLELFALGRGYYTEEDVKEAARVLTGWRAINFRNSRVSEVFSQFTANLHDTGDKKFSEHFQQKAIAGHTGSAAGEEELGALIDMILAHPEAARFIVRKLYRWYFTGEISPEVEANFIVPLADEFREDYQIAPLLKRMLTSSHFFDESIRGAQIRSPLDFTVGTLQAFDAYIPTPADDRPAYDLLTNSLLRKCRLMEMEVLEQPTVFGWRPYYDTGYYKIWISGTTLGLRGELTDAIADSTPRQGFRTNLVEWVAFVSNPGDPEVLVKEVWNLLMAVEPTPEQLDEIIDGPFLDGIPRYEWTGIWLNYTAHPTDNNAYLDARQRLVLLLTYMLRLAEYQLA
jgi:uncharacterized protein (DUF1800 family)